MNITLKGTHHELTEATRQMVEEKLGALRKFTANDPTALLGCEIEESIRAVRAGAKYRAEGNLRAHGKFYRAEALGETLEAALDRVRDDLVREVRRVKGREHGLMRRSGAAIKNFFRFGR